MHGSGTPQPSRERTRCPRFPSPPPPRDRSRPPPPPPCCAVGGARANRLVPTCCAGVRARARARAPFCAPREAPALALENPALDKCPFSERGSSWARATREARMQEAREAVRRLLAPRRAASPGRKHVREAEAASPRPRKSSRSASPDDGISEAGKSDAARERSQRQGRGDSPRRRAETCTPAGAPLPGPRLPGSLAAASEASFDTSPGDSTLRELVLRLDMGDDRRSERRAETGVPPASNGFSSPLPEHSPARSWAAVPRGYLGETHCGRPICAERTPATRVHASTATHAPFAFLAPQARRPSTGVHPRSQTGGSERRRDRDRDRDRGRDWDGRRRHRPSPRASESPSPLLLPFQEVPSARVPIASPSTPLANSQSDVGAGPLLQAAPAVPGGWQSRVPLAPWLLPASADEMTHYSPERVPGASEAQMPRGRVGGERGGNEGPRPAWEPFAAGNAKDRTDALQWDANLSKALRTPTGTPRSNCLPACPPPESASCIPPSPLGSSPFLASPVAPGTLPRSRRAPSLPSPALTVGSSTLQAEDLALVSAADDRAVEALAPLGPLRLRAAFRSAQREAFAIADAANAALPTVRRCAVRIVGKAFGAEAPGEDGGENVQVEEGAEASSPVTDADGGFQGDASELCIRSWPYNGHLHVDDATHRARQAAEAFRETLRASQGSPSQRRHRLQAGPVQGKPAVVGLREAETFRPSLQGTLASAKRSNVVGVDKAGKKDIRSISGDAERDGGNAAEQKAEHIIGTAAEQKAEHAIGNAAEQKAEHAIENAAAARTPALPAATLPARTCPAPLPWLSSPAHDTVRAFCVERASRTGGHYRRFAAASVPALWREAFRASPPSARHWYEIVRDSSRCHVYFDIEFCRLANPDVDGDALVDAIVHGARETLCETFGWLAHRRKPEKRQGEADASAGITKLGAGNDRRSGGRAGGAFEDEDGRIPGIRSTRYGGPKRSAGDANADAPLLASSSSPSSASSSSLALPPFSFFPPEWISELDSSTPARFSRHLVLRIPGYAWASNADVGRLATEAVRRAGDAVWVRPKLRADARGDDEERERERLEREAREQGDGEEGERPEDDDLPFESPPASLPRSSATAREDWASLCDASQTASHADRGNRGDNGRREGAPGGERHKAARGRAGQSARQSLATRSPVPLLSPSPSPSIDSFRTARASERSLRGSDPADLAPFLSPTTAPSSPFASPVSAAWSGPNASPGADCVSVLSDPSRAVTPSADLSPRIVSSLPGTLDPLREGLSFEDVEPAKASADGAPSAELPPCDGKFPALDSFTVASATPARADAASEPLEWVLAVDLAVYTRNRHFRLLGCSKGGKEALLVPTARFAHVVRENVDGGGDGSATAVDSTSNASKVASATGRTGGDSGAGAAPGRASPVGSASLVSYGISYPLHAEIELQNAGAHRPCTNQQSTPPQATRHPSTPLQAARHPSTPLQTAPPPFPAHSPNSPSPSSTTASRLPLPRPLLCAAFPLPHASPLGALLASLITLTSPSDVSLAFPPECCAPDEALPPSSRAPAGGVRTPGLVRRAPLAVAGIANWAGMLANSGDDERAETGDPRPRGAEDVRLFPESAKANMGAATPLGVPSASPAAVAAPVAAMAEALASEVPQTPWLRAAGARVVWRLDERDRGADPRDLHGATRGQTGVGCRRALRLAAESLTPAMERLGSSRARGLACRVRTVALCGAGGSVAYSLVGPGSHRCEHIGRDHASNHVFFVVDLAKGEWAQKCYDPDCAGYKSPWRPLGPVLGSSDSDVQLWKPKHAAVQETGATRTDEETIASDANRDARQDAEPKGRAS